MRSTIKVHHPNSATTLPTHEQAARRRRTQTERPIATTGPRPRRRPTPPATSDALRKTADTRFPIARVTQA